MVEHGKSKLLVGAVNVLMRDDGIGARGLPELLFDLETDPGERKNLYYRNQELAADMRRQYLAWERDVEASAARA